MNAATIGVLAPVVRRFLEAVDGTPYETRQSGRLELANSVVRECRPLTARVAVNRIWHYLFGQGLVATPDNFGRLGVRPSHPELLDYVARRFVDEGWSIKQAIRWIVLSETWQAASEPTPKAAEVDPENLLLTHTNLRRLDAESIRDAMLAVSGRLDATMFGPPVSANRDNARAVCTSRRTGIHSTYSCRSLTHLSRFPPPVVAM